MSHMLILTTVSLTANFVLVALLFYLYRKFRKRSRTRLVRIIIRRSITTRQELPAPSPVFCYPNLSAGIHQYDLFIRLHSYLQTNKNFTDPDLDTNRLASQLSTNRSYLFEAVRVSTGMTLQEYLNSLRLEEGKCLLNQTDEEVETVANRCGYNSVRTFYRLFQAAYHSTPAAYRKKIREMQNASLVR